MSGAAQRPPRSRQARPGGVRSVLAGIIRWGVAAIVVLLLSFFLLLRGGVFAYQHWTLGAWSSLALSAGATMLVLATFAWVAGRRFGAGRRLRKYMTRTGALAAVGFVAWSLLVIAGGNVKSEEVRAEYSSLHPLLRVAVSAFVLADSEAVITDASRTPDFYARAGLPPSESSLHFRQADGFVHALDLRTRGRPEWRNRVAELAFGLMGFHALRHVGTADHLHVSLRPGRNRR